MFKKYYKVIYLVPLIVTILVLFFYLGFTRQKYEQQKPVGEEDIISIGKTNSLAGIIGLKEYNEKNDESFFDETYINPYVSGLALRIGWKSLEPEENKFNWSITDELFNKASSGNKFIVLIIVPGFETPGWALQGVQTQAFSQKYGDRAGDNTKLPLPWDSVYLLRWSTFLEQLSKRYKSNSAFKMISVAGPTSVSAEMSLPNTDEAIRKWQKLEYQPSKYIAAWKQMFETYAKLFPNQYLSLALYPGLPINSAGYLDQSAKTVIRQAIINIGVNDHSEQFALQTSGLHGGGDAAGFNIVRDYNGQVLTGFQLSTSVTRNPEKMGDASDPVNALKLTIDKGLAPNSSNEKIQYLEIYEPDILNPNMQEVLKYTSEQLK